MKKDFTVYNEAFREANGVDAPPPISGAFCLVDEDPVKAKELGEQYIGAYYESAMKHYEFTSGHLKDLKTYQFYDGINKYIAKHGKDQATADFVSLMPFGTPDEVIEKLRFVNSQIHNNGFMVSFSYGGMPHDISEKSMRLFAEKVLPEVKKIDTEPLAILKSA